MEALVPLKESIEGKNGQLCVVADVPSSCNGASSKGIVGDGKGLLCIYEGSLMTLCRIKERRLLIVAELFFRRVGKNCILTTLAAKGLLDFPVSDKMSSPTMSDAIDVRLSTLGDVACAAFVKGNVVVGTTGGYLAMFSVVESTSSVIGCTLMSPQESQSWWWDISASTATAVALRSNGILFYSVDGAMTLQDRKVDGLTIENVSSVSACASEHDDCFSVFVAHVGSRDITLVETSGGLGFRCSRFTILSYPIDERVYTSQQVHIYAVDWNELAIVATVYPDAVSFSSWKGGELTSLVAISNEIDVPFGPSLWRKTGSSVRLYVLRTDGVCTVYDVAVDASRCTTSEVTIVGQVALPFPLGYLLGDADTGRFLSVRDPKWLSRRGDVQLETSMNGEFESVDVGCVREVHNSVLLLDVVSVGKTHGILTLHSSGICYLSVGGQSGRVVLAQISYPYGVTSCLTLEMTNGARLCALGFCDGDVTVFVDGAVFSSVRMAHCGPVDKLIWLPKMNETDDTLFLSVSTEMGTVCFHGSEKALVTRTMCSPSRPLTSCVLDRDAEYIFLTSHNVGNLWHYPSCRLERSFCCAKGDLGRCREDLLKSCSLSAVKVEKVLFFGGYYHSIRTNISFLTEQMGSGEQTHECMLALALLSHCLGETFPAIIPEEVSIYEALSTASLTVGKAREYEYVAATVVMLCALLDRAEDRTVAAAVVSTVLSLSKGLSAAVWRSTEYKAVALAHFFSCFFDLKRPTPAPMRYALNLLVQSIAPDDMEAVLALLRKGAMVAATAGLKDSEDHQPRPLFDYSNPKVFLIVLCGMIIREGHMKLCANTVLWDYLCEEITTMARGFFSSAAEVDALKENATSLLALAEGFSLLKAADKSQKLSTTFVQTLLARAFEGQQSIGKTLCLEALERVVAQDPQWFMSTFFTTSFDEHPNWRPYMAVFLAHLAKDFPFAVYVTLPHVVRLLLKAMSSGASVGKDGPGIYRAAVLKTLSAFTSILPNLSLQQSLHHVALGTNSGDVMVYSLKNGAPVACFSAHQEPVLGVAYSSNIMSLDIATISESMKELRVWRTPNQTNSIASFFTGGSIHFKLVCTVDVPSPGFKSSDVSLLINFIALKWLSPQCVEFCSPWHGQVQISLP